MILQNLIVSVESLSATIHDGFTRFLDLKLVDKISCFLFTDLGDDCDNVEEFTRVHLAEISTALSSAEVVPAQKGGGAAGHILWRVQNAMVNLEKWLNEYFLQVLFLYVYNFTFLC